MGAPRLLAAGFALAALVLVPAASARVADDDESCCLNVITSARYDPDARTLTVSWLSPGEKLCPLAVWVNATKPKAVNNEGIRYSWVIGNCETTTWKFSLEKGLCPCTSAPNQGPFDVTRDFYVSVSFVCRAGDSAAARSRGCRGLPPDQMYLGSQPVVVKAAGTPTKPVQPKPTVITKDETATVQCGTGGGATSVRFVGSSSERTIDTRSSVDLPIELGGVGGAPVTWTMTRALVPGWPVSAFGSDYGKLSISGCGAQYTAPSNTGSSPRMFVEIRAKVDAPGCGTTRTPGEGGPCFAVSPAKLVITIRGGEVTPGGGYCGREYLQVAVSNLASFYVSDGYRIFGPYLSSRTFQPIAIGRWRVQIYYRTGGSETVDITVPRCAGARVVRG
jgi:hypothetical protein